MRKREENVVVEYQVEDGQIVGIGVSGSEATRTNYRTAMDLLAVLGSVGAGDRLILNGTYLTFLRATIAREARRLNARLLAEAEEGEEERPPATTADGLLDEALSEAVAYFRDRAEGADNRADRARYEDLIEELEALREV